LEISPKPVKPVRKISPLAVASLLLGLLYLPGYLLAHPLCFALSQVPENCINTSLFSLPYLFPTLLLVGSMAAGIISLVQIRKQNKGAEAQVVVKGAWMAIVGLVLDMFGGFLVILFLGLIITH
jgi:hypothetical protein